MDPQDLCRDESFKRELTSSPPNDIPIKFTVSHPDINLQPKPLVSPSPTMDHHSAENQGLVQTFFGNRSELISREKEQRSGKSSFSV